ncbi:NADPH-dependent FMN reductase [Paenibacillus sp. F411]|uniref:FMN reductase n=1 Tax=Paenibacillus algicola TaxID=2565926 RepID=A0A4P8XFN5_9BACL|nr:MULTISPECIES: NADPH-dependent FMN reductase [Paenibacillus]MBO2945912.1 NADPH-dependent FMN reductase [Paenibacillus sp. F411]QCT01212.1 FMN reductase [Paenibacillus algicola]
MKKAVIINGSPTPGSRLTALMEQAEKGLEAAGYEVSRIDVAQLPAEDLILARFDSEYVIKANGLVAEADAVIIASPVYKASFTGVLKTFLDLIPQKGLAGKIILPLFIGGSLAHLLSIDYSLKPVLSSMGARFILGGVYAVDAQVARTEEGGLEIAEVLQERLHAALEELIAETGLRIAQRQEQK